MFPDIANFCCIRDALWRHKSLGGASIMVGAGFSRNASPITVGVRPMPDWKDLAGGLCERLYPFAVDNQKRALHQASSTSGFLRLAEEFKSAFGKPALDDFIRNHVPDLDYEPGDLHKRLLALPWSDVFTTNWDTLLERSCIDVFERNYDIIHTANEIPNSARPRITKLHGSLPSHEPFIFTEEDFRKYPIQFSPFVNLVQQSMMETIFCLIGFSGDDPNFLQWSGWVRDNLGPNAPKTFLIGWLDLPAHRRRMLEARNVMIVDLSALPLAASWPKHLRHRYATEWFVAALEYAKPYDRTRWPSSPPSLPQPPAILGAVPTNSQRLPLRAGSPKLGGSRVERMQALEKEIRTWLHNRKLYPGWLIAPEHARVELVGQIRLWYSEYDIIKDLSNTQKFLVLGEIAWQFERALLPYPDSLQELSLHALSGIDPLSQTVFGCELSDDYPWLDIEQLSISLALNLTRAARQRGDRTRFDRALNHLVLLSKHTPQGVSLIEYEECLWELMYGNLENLQKRLSNWQPSNFESLWCLRKVGLLAGMQEHIEARRLLESTLLHIRRTTRRDTDDIESLSLEGLALFLALAYSHPIVSDGRAQYFSELSERRRQLRRFGCDVLDEYGVLRRQATQNSTARPGIVKNVSFDLDHYSTGYQIAAQMSDLEICSYQLLFFSELTALPASANRMTILGDGLKLAVKILDRVDAWVSMHLTARLDGNDNYLNDTMSRRKLAHLDISVVASIRDTLTKRLDFYLKFLSAGNADREYLHNAAMCLEKLSRIIVRLPEKEVVAYLILAINYYRSDSFRQNAVQIGQQLSNFLKRVLDSLQPRVIEDHLLKLFATPLPNDGNFTVEHNFWADPISLIPSWFNSTPSAIIGDLQAWSNVVTMLIGAARSDDVVNRRVAIYRLSFMQKWKLLAKEDQEAFAHALWLPQHEGKRGLPDSTGLKDWVLLMLPEERAGQAKQGLIDFVANGLSGDNNDEFIIETGEIIAGARSLGITVELKENAKKNLRKAIKEWAERPMEEMHEIEQIFNRTRETRRDLSSSIAEIINGIEIGTDVLASIRDKVTRQNSEQDIPPFELYVYVSGRFPDLQNRLLTRLHKALLSTKEDLVWPAVNGLYGWVREKSDACDVGSEVDELVREIGIAIASRRPPVIRPALSFARWVFRHGPSRIRSSISKDCKRGLSALWEEASYERTDQQFDVPSIRAACLRLAVAMKDSGFGDGEGIEGWIEAAHSDPLPEVRNAEARGLD